MRQRRQRMAYSWISCFGTNHERTRARSRIYNKHKKSIHTTHRIARMLFSLLLSLCFSCAGIPSGGRRLADRPTYLTYPLPCIRGGFTVTCSRGFSPHSVRSCCKKQEHACLPILSFCWFIYQSIVLIYLRILYFSVHMILLYMPGHIFVKDVLPTKE